MLDVKDDTYLLSARHGVRPLFRALASEGPEARRDWAARIAPAVLEQRAALEAIYASAPAARTSALEALADSCVIGLTALARAELAPRWPSMSAPVALLAAGRYGADDEAADARRHLILSWDDPASADVAGALALFLSAGLRRLDLGADIQSLRLGRRADETALRVDGGLRWRMLWGSAGLAAASGLTLGWGEADDAA